MKYYDKTMYKTEQNAKIIFIILITFILGFFIRYWVRGFDSNKEAKENIVKEVSKIEYNIYEGNK